MKNSGYNIVKLNTGRNCLRYIVKVFEIKEIYIPYYICPAIRTSLNKENCKINYYHIDKTFKPKESFPDNSYILYPDYFGVCSHIVNEMAGKYKNLIIDNAHSFFFEPKGIACFNSVRKFFPYLMSGAFLYLKSDKIIPFAFDEYNYNFDEYSFEKFIENENRLDLEDIKYMNAFIEKRFSLIDKNAEKTGRIDKFQLFHNKYGMINSLKINIQNIRYPYCYPYLAENTKEADTIVKEFKSRGINIFRYWNNLPDSFEEKIFYERLVAIPL